MRLRQRRRHATPPEDRQQSTNGGILVNSVARKVTNLRSKRRRHKANWKNKGAQPLPCRCRYHPLVTP
ncbi:hypothetical protein WN943_005967 [Citrus x changshan-huyou]